jgi:tetratricopeptide (TPR) repeat protein
MDPRGYHATSFLFHALNAILFFLLLRALARRAWPELSETTGSYAAAAGALCFSIHPLRVESVAWITERRDLVSGAFFLLALFAYVRMTGEPEGAPARRKWLALSSTCFAAMILSKAMALTLPFVLLVMDVYPLRRLSRATVLPLLREKIPYFALMIGAFVMLSFSAGKAQGVTSRENYPLIQSLAQPGFRLCFYVSKTLLPLNLSPLYWYRPGIGAPQIVGWLAILALTGVLVIGRRRFPAPLAACVCYGLLIAPASGVIQFGPMFAGDRYTYLACLPFAALATVALVLLSRRFPPALLGAAAAALLAGLGLLTFRQSRIWRDSISLWNHAIELDPDVYLSRYYRGRAFAAQGRWEPALSDYDRSVELQGGWFESRGYRAQARLKLGDATGAVQDATLALQINPTWSEAFVTRGQALSKLGNVGGAISDFSTALSRRPHYVEARILRATEWSKTGNLDAALIDLDEAVSFDPQPSIYVRRGMTRAMREDREGAAADFARALELAPPDWPPRRQVQEYLQRVRTPK